MMRKINLYGGRHIVKQLKNIGRKNDLIKKKLSQILDFFFGAEQNLKSHKCQKNYLMNCLFF